MPNLADRTPCLRRTISAALFATMALTPMTATAAGHDGPLAAKFAYCQDCHGPNGQGFRGYYRSIVTITGTDTPEIKVLQALSRA